MMIRKIIEKFDGLIVYIESERTPLIYFFSSFFFIAAIRLLFEQFSGEGVYYDYDKFFHYALAFLFGALFVTFFLVEFLKLDIIKTLKVVFFAFGVIIFPPIIDLIVSFGKGYPIMYAPLTEWSEWPYYILTFFGHFTGEGVTPGIRIEVAIILVGLFFYLKNKTSYKLAIFGVAGVYVFFTLWFAATFLINKYLSFFNFSLDYPDNFLTQIFLIGDILLILPLLLRLNYKRFVLYLQEMSWLRVVHYIFSVFFGVILAMTVSGTGFKVNLPSLILAIFALVLAAYFVVVINNIFDQEIDRISNQERALVGRKVSEAEYKKLILPLFAGSLFVSAISSVHTIFFVLLFIGFYYIYSAPPYRIKRYFLVSKMIISFNSLLMVMLGFLLSGQLLDAFPVEIVVFYLLIVTIVVNFIDLKDYEGDKAAGIKTLPIVVGLKKSKIIISLSFFVAYASAYFVLRLDFIFLIPIALVAILQIYFVMREPYRERPVFLTYLAAMLLIGGAMLYSL
ncbi:MAG: UbiA family prenyltransferase [bacterium]